MKSNLLRTILEWALLTSLIICSFFFIRYFFRSREIRSLQPQLQTEAMNYQNTHTKLNQMAGDLIEYAKHDPTVLPILEMIGYKAGKPGIPASTVPGAAPAAPKPAK